VEREGIVGFVFIAHGGMCGSWIVARD
jgi:hypothetical protein